MLSGAFSARERFCSHQEKNNEVASGYRTRFGLCRGSTGYAGQQPASTVGGDPGCRRLWRRLAPRTTRWLPAQLQPALASRLPARISHGAVRTLPPELLIEATDCD